MLGSSVVVAGRGDLIVECKRRTFRWRMSCVAKVEVR